MGTKILQVEISDVLHDRFYKVVTEKGGKWRSRNKKEAAYKAVQSAVEIALKGFLDSLESRDNKS
jgi:hypothetical protein